MVNVYRPASLEEALKIRAEKGALLFAGGTDLMVRYRAKNSLAPAINGPVVFLDRVAELKKTGSAGGFLEVGAAVNLSVLAGDPGAEKADVPELLRAAAASIAAPALRNRATLAGNVANASPAGDGLCALVALDAQVVLVSEEGERVLSVHDFVTGPGRTELKDNEIIKSFRFPEPLPSLSYWRKVGTRKANALTKVSLAASVRVENDGPDKGLVTKCLLAFGAVGPRIARLDITGILNKHIDRAETPVSAEALNKAATEIAAEADSLITPIDDQRSTAVYRKKTALNLVSDFVYKTFATIKQQGDNND
jgi:CO/xanthine dehydrogenase FAD-binding subunit